MSTTIADVKYHVLEAKIDEPFWWSFNQSDARGSCVVEIIAEDGTSGWGECFGPGLGIEINRDVLAEYTVRD